MSTARKLLWLRHASADQARQLQAAVPSMDLEKASKSWLPRPSPGRTAATVITFDGLGQTLFTPLYRLLLVLTFFLAARCCALLGSSSCSRSLVLCAQPAPRLPL
jgi:hypothetical protein